MNKLFIIIIGGLLLGSCKDPYNIPLKDTDQSMLVVEGVLVLGADSTTISLSKSIKVNENAVYKAVPGAKLTVENKNGNSIALTEISGGRYTNQLNLTAGSEYRLRIKTSDSKEYLSDYVVAKQTPAIDSVTWKVENGDLIIYANTHDPLNNTKYYKWDFDETWEINSYYFADYQWVGGTTIIPNPGYHYRCWKYGRSTTINLGSTAQLSEDRISESPVMRIPAGSEKLSVRYSILLKQQSLAKEAFEYFTLMKKNTESLGSIFDPQPSEMGGNVKCISHPTENVIGYVTSSSISQKRIFITRQQAGWSFTQNCDYVRVPNIPDSLKQWLPTFLPWGGEEVVPGVVSIYYLAPGACVDCTLRGGNLGMPSYW